MNSNEIREAVDDVASPGDVSGASVAVVLDAARAYADLIDKGSWCHSHDGLTGEDRRWFQTRPEPCEPWLP